MKILAIFTCHNRAEKTELCIRSLCEGNKECGIDFIVVDDGSTDDTHEKLGQMKQRYSLCVLEGDGSLFYSGGMRRGMCYAKENMKAGYDYLLLINDDVEFYDQCLSMMIDQSQGSGNSIIAGTLNDTNGNLSYGGIKYTRGIHYRILGPEDSAVRADTFNANCVLIPFSIFLAADVMDEHYIHSLGDFDYGLQLSKEGYAIYPSRKYIGICNDNLQEETWRDTRLSIKKRIQKKESVKGAPTKQWFYFLKKNFGLYWALRGCFTPYIRILLRL